MVPSGRASTPSSAIADAHADRLRGGVVAGLQCHGADRVLRAVGVFNAVGERLVDAEDDALAGFGRRRRKLRSQPCRVRFDLNAVMASAAPTQRNGTGTANSV